MAFLKKNTEDRVNYTNVNNHDNRKQLTNFPNNSDYKITETDHTFL